MLLRRGVSAVACDTVQYKSAFRLSVVKTKTKKITTANQREKKTFNSQWELEVKTTKLPIVRENAGDQVVSGFRFTSYWLKEWRGVSGPIMERNKAEPKITLYHVDGLIF